MKANTKRDGMKGQRRAPSPSRGYNLIHCSFRMTLLAISLVTGVLFAKLVMPTRRITEEG